MRILVLGSGAREHAILWRLNQSADRHELFVCPGNVGMDNLAERLTVPDRPSNEEYAALAAENNIDLTIVGPENYLVNGIVDVFQARNLRVFGPTAAAARLEGSKVWAKEIMQGVGIPTASWRSFTNYDEARQRAAELGWRCVVKADGLAAGKGAFVCHDEGQVDAALKELARTKDTSSSIILVEELLVGQEVSVFAISDGRTVVPFGAAQDHKRLRDRDEGPNTGGMGAYSPVNHMLVAQGFADSFFQPLVTSLRTRGIPYVGVLYAGAIVTTEGPKILEFNCRFGDPEAEVLLRRLDSDLATLLAAATEGTLHTIAEPAWSAQEALCVIAASKNYPRENDFGSPITGLEAADRIPEVIVFHGGTEADPVTGQLITNGGRIFCVTAIGETLHIAHERAYGGIRELHFDGIQYRGDIGTKALPEAWETRWRKSPRWEMQMRAVTGGLDSVASAIQRLQLHGGADTDTVKELQTIRQQVYALKLQTLMPGNVTTGGGVRLTWSLLASYADHVASTSSPPALVHVSTGKAVDDEQEDEVGEANDPQTASLGSPLRGASLDLLSFQLAKSTLRFERHENYDMLVWNAHLTSEAAIDWLEKQRDAASMFYIDTSSYTYSFDYHDVDLLSMLEPNEEVISVRLETPSYTCIWNAPAALLDEKTSHFAILSRTLLVEDVWWFMKGSIDPRDTDAFVDFLGALQELADDEPHLLEVG